MTRSGGRRALPAALAIGALLLATAPGNGGGTQGSSDPCAQDVRVFSTGVVTIAGTEGVVCPPPAAPPGTGFGPPSSQPGSSTGGTTPGTPCSYQVLEPLKITPQAAGEPIVSWQVPIDGVFTHGPMSIGFFVGGGQGGDWTPFYFTAGTVDFYQIYQFSGVIQQDRFTCGPAPGKTVAQSWQQICGGYTFGVYAACLTSQNHAFGGPAGPLPITALPPGLALAGYLQGQVNPGKLTSSAAGIVQAPTCFYLDGMTISGQDAMTPHWYEITLVAGPVDGSNRYILYVFRVEVVLDGVQFQYSDPSGDNSNALSIPSYCASGHQYTAAHTYTHFSPAGQPFQVTATEHYAVHAWEYWNDGQPHGIQLPDSEMPALDPIAGPLPMPILQEESVPVGG